MKPLEAQLAEITELIGGLMKVVDAKTFVDTVCELIDANVAAEREACAKIAEGYHKWSRDHLMHEEVVAVMPDRIAAAIRARGKEE